MNRCLLEEGFFFTVSYSNLGVAWKMCGGGGANLWAVYM